jgi:hypothetical protein
MGEWIAGPLFVVQHGRSVLWIATLAFVLQSLLNLEAVRYTLYTGEPVLTGFMRLQTGIESCGAGFMRWQALRSSACLRRRQDVRV